MCDIEYRQRKKSTLPFSLKTVIDDIDMTIKSAGWLKVIIIVNV